MDEATNVIERPPEADETGGDRPTERPASHGWRLEYNPAIDGVRSTNSPHPPRTTTWPDSVSSTAVPIRGERFTCPSTPSRSSRRPVSTYQRGCG